MTDREEDVIALGKKVLARKAAKPEKPAPQTPERGVVVRKKMSDQLAEERRNGNTNPQPLL